MANEAELQAYARAVSRAGASAQRQVEKLLRAYFKQNPGTNVASARGFAIDLVEAAGTQYGEAASAAALELRASMAAAAGEDVGEGVPFVYKADRAEIDSNAHYQAGKLADGDRDAFIAQMGETAQHYAMRGANETMDAATAKDGRKSTKVRYALVPSGGAPCTHCLQRAGHGFVYLSARSADAARPHKHCNCLVVPGYGDNPKLKGYDPAKYRRQWKASQQEKNSSRFFSSGDPAREYFGSAYEHNPARYREINEAYSEAGVRIKTRAEDREAIAYQPGLVAGEPGTLYRTEGMSLSAEEHEFLHFKQDQALGFPGFRYYLERPELWDRMEEEAYGIEISMAQAANNDILVERLKENKLEDLKRRGRPINGQDL